MPTISRQTDSRQTEKRDVTQGWENEGGAVPQVREEQRPAARPGDRIDQIRERAYDIYVARRATGLPGDAETDWLRAEREVGVMRGRDR